MKQDTEEPDYRSMNEVQLKYELIKLEKKILDIIGDPIDYKHYSPFLDWCRDDAKVEAVEGDDAGPLLHPESPFRHPLHAGRGGLSEINQQLQHAAEILKNTILQSNLRLS